MQDSEFAVDIEHATLKLDGRTVLHDLSWQVRRGERWFILGPNGAGKTTLVKMILGLIWPLFGAKVSVLGHLYGRTNLQDVRKKIAWSSPFMQAWTNETQNASLRVLDVVLSGLDSTVGFYRRANADEIRRADEILEMLFASSIRESPFAHVSSGEQVKALIARTLIAKPELLVLDETCVHLDLSSREILLDAVDSLAEKSPQMTVLFVTQRIEEITRVFGKGLILGNGRIAAQGIRSEILTPENLQGAFHGLRLRLLPGPNGRFWPLPSDSLSFKI